MGKQAKWLTSSVIALGSYCGSTWAVLPIDLDAGLEALGSVDLDGRTGPGAPASQLIDHVEVPPAFARSSVGVADALPGVFSYAASSDVGTLALRLDGTISNTTTNAYFGQGQPVMLISSQAKDVVTLVSSLPGDYEVSLELVVNGSISTTGATPRLAPFANAQIQFGQVGGTSGNDSARYDVGTISDTLRVTRTFSGPSVDASINTFLSFSVFDVAPGASASGELGNTAFIRLILPEQGVTIAGSESGTFGVSIPIPEPQTYMLMLFGLAVVARSASRAHRA